MTDNRGLIAGCDGDRAASGSDSAPIDFVFLAVQTFDDRELQHDVLRLFVAQAQRVVPSLPGLSAREQADAAHLLKGSARGIGAWPAAAAADAYEAAAPDRRDEPYRALCLAFEAANAAIATALDDRPDDAGR